MCTRREYFFVGNKTCEAAASRRISFKDSLVFRSKIHELARGDFGFRLVKMLSSAPIDRVAVSSGSSSNSTMIVPDVLSCR